MEAFVLTVIVCFGGNCEAKLVDESMVFKPYTLSQCIKAAEVFEEENYGYVWECTPLTTYMEGV